MTGLRVLALAGLVVLAGCGTSYAEHPFWTGDQDNPWREAELTVAIEAETGDAETYRTQVREALDFWEDGSGSYAGYPLRYRLEPGAEDPDLVIAFVADVSDCGNHDHTAGCAPILDSPAQVQRPVRVRIKTGFSPASTQRILKHELGHTLGLTHDDEPASVMAAKSSLQTEPQPDATERALPWSDPELAVYVAEPGTDPEEVERQVTAALEYYAAGADGTVPENVSFVRTDDPQAADVLIRFGPAGDCTEAPGSCGSVSGTDPDGDGALETYTELRIRLVDVDAKATGWHVGHWLGFGFGFDETADYPPPLRDASYEERRSDWWAT